MSRQLDADIERTLGYDVVLMTETICENGKKYYNHIEYGEKDGLRFALPPYSTDPYAMLQLDYILVSKGWFIIVEKLALSTGNSDIYYVTLKQFDPVYKAVVATGGTEMMARALAAYKALSGKDWEVGNEAIQAYI